MNGPIWRRIVGIMVLLLLAGCWLDQGSASTPSPWDPTALAQDIGTFIEDFARQALAAFLL